MTSDQQSKSFIPNYPQVLETKVGKRKRYKDTLKQTLKLTDINAETWHELAEDRTAWRKAVKKGVRSFEDDRVKAREEK